MNLLPELVKSNFHIHTHFSACAAADMIVPNILSQAKKRGLKKVALVDHDHDNKNDLLNKINLVKNEVEKFHPQLELIVGAELSAFGINKFGDTLAINRKIDFRLYSTNHYHLAFWEHPAERTARAYAEHTLCILENLINAKRADCIAHPFVGIYLHDILADHTQVTQALSDNELADILELGKKNQVAWELNTKAIFFDPIFAKRLWAIGREVGVKFLVGTDAHHLSEIEDPPVIEQKLKMILTRA